jgi:hypothetical protein
MWERKVLEVKKEGKPQHKRKYLRGLDERKVWGEENIEV